MTLMDVLTHPSIISHSKSRSKLRGINPKRNKSKNKKNPIDIFSYILQIIILSHFFLLLVLLTLDYFIKIIRFVSIVFPDRS
jgi:hypothetical protein